MESVSKKLASFPIVVDGRNRQEIAISPEEIHDTFLPLYYAIKDKERIATREGRRCLVGIVGPPGAGKSTFAQTFRQVWDAVSACSSQGAGSFDACAAPRGPAHAGAPAQPSTAAAAAPPTPATAPPTPATAPPSSCAVLGGDAYHRYNLELEATPLPPGILRPEEELAGAATSGEPPTLKMLKGHPVTMDADRCVGDLLRFCCLGVLQRPAACYRRTLLRSGAPVPLLGMLQRATVGSYAQLTAV